MKLAIVLFNLGGPDSLDAVQPFLRNLFSDPSIIALPALFRLPLAAFIANRRAPIAKKIYAQMGGGSPIVAETEAQADAIEAALSASGHNAKCFIAMRYWHPFTLDAASKIKKFAPDRIVLLPLYPQYSTTTTRSSMLEWRKCASRLDLRMPQHEICCYPTEAGFAAAAAALIQQALIGVKPGISYRILFSAHGLPKRIVEKGDPYPRQIEQSVAAILAKLGPAMPGAGNLDSSICYQSRVGPLEWIGPATDAEIRRAGAEGKGVIVVPVAFVSEHSETLVELDIEYRHLAEKSGVKDYIRVSTVRDHPKFIGALKDLILTALVSQTPVTSAPERICPRDCICGHERASGHA